MCLQSDHVPTVIECEGTVCVHENSPLKCLHARQIAGATVLCLGLLGFRSPVLISSSSTCPATYVPPPAGETSW